MNKLNMLPLLVFRFRSSANWKQKRSCLYKMQYICQYAETQIVVYLILVVVARPEMDVSENHFYHSHLIQYTTPRNEPTIATKTIEAKTTSPMDTIYIYRHHTNCYEEAKE